MRRVLIGFGLLALLVALTAALVGPAAAGKRTPTCQGEKATIVGDRNGLPDEQPLDIFGTDGADVIVGTAGRDAVDAGGGDDLVCLGGGNDSYLVGLFQNGNDEVYGQSGNDNLFDASGNDVFIGGQGSDTCKGGRGTDAEAPATEGQCEAVAGIP